MVVVDLNVFQFAGRGFSANWLGCRGAGFIPWFTGDWLFPRGIWSQQLLVWWFYSGVPQTSKVWLAWRLGPRDVCGLEAGLRRLCRRVLSSFLLDDLIATGGSLLEPIFQLQDSLF
jgi:hypothetical protein